jgi:hemerythrin
MTYNAGMRSLKWDSSHAVFVTEIDDEHKEIFGAVGELKAALRGNGPTGNIDELIQRLANRIEDHFAHEERLMRAARYGLLSWHKRSHDAARKRVSRWIRRIGRGDTDAVSVLVEYLTSWLHNHSRLADMMLGAFLRNERRAGTVTFTAGTASINSGQWFDLRGQPFDPFASRTGF